MMAILAYSRDAGERSRSIPHQWHGEIFSDSKNVGECSPVEIINKIAKLCDYDAAKGFKLHILRITQIA